MSSVIFNINRKIIAGNRPDLFIDPSRFVMLVKSDNTGTSGANQFTFTGAEVSTGSTFSVIYSHEDTPFNYTEVTLNVSDPTITFPSAGRYYVQAGLPFQRIVFNNGGDRLKVVARLAWGDIVWNSFDLAFWGASNAGNLPNIPIPNVGSVSSFLTAFRDNNLTSIPVALFDNATGVTSFPNTFRGNSLTSIPAGLFDNNPLVTTFINAFRDNSLTSIPAGLFDNNPLVTNFQEIFRAGIVNGTAVPPDLFKNNIRCGNYSSCFEARSMAVNSLSGMYISLANTIIRGNVSFHGGTGNYDPAFTDATLGAGDTATNRAILVGANSVTVSGATDTNANGLYTRTSATVWTNANSYTFTRATDTFTLADGSAVTLATGTTLDVDEAMPHSVERLGNAWSGTESGITVALTGAGWTLTDGGAL